MRPLFIIALILNSLLGLFSIYEIIYLNMQTGILRLLLSIACIFIVIMSNRALNIKKR